MAKKNAPPKQPTPKNDPGPKKNPTPNAQATKEKKEILILGNSSLKEVKTKIRAPVEELHNEELRALIQNDTYPKPPNWKLSPKMVELFITGCSEQFPLKENGQSKKISISTKFYGDKNLIQKAIVTLASERALMLIGEPGTAKSWLSEHLAAAISGISTYLIQGTAGTTEDQIRYSWNYALLVSEGPSPKSLVATPTINAMREGKILRFEELTRCPQEIQDSMISILSEKVVPIPELGSQYLIYGVPGFNVIATANDRDRGVNEMSAALKRRFNFIYIPVMQQKDLEKKIVVNRTNELLSNIGFKVQIPEETLDLLITVFQELRSGQSFTGGRFQPISGVMSTSEEISLLFDSAIYAKFFGDEKIEPNHIAMIFIDSVVKDDKENLPKLREYFNLVVSTRCSTSKLWESFYTAFKKNI
ncbi:MAG: AAA family ATPase [Promethearchaeota archaeon]|nr:MAG: AAA family ATPase [Candidatus Lokiarchaeota archaeon]